MANSETIVENFSPPLKGKVMSMHERHWEHRLPRPLRDGDQVTITAHHADGAMIMLASRIEALHAALSQPAGTTPSEDALAGEDTQDLLRLLDHLHRVIGTLIGQEDRLIEVLAEKGVSHRRIATAMEVNHRTVGGRRRRIAQAADDGLNTRGFVEKQLNNLE